MNNIRNFCIIAHIDHGKSTLADRFLELTGTVEKRKMQNQLLDQMDLERERGITIKLQPVRMDYQGYELNLIDTPGHVDFSYEVSRSLAAVEGAILLVDATQGIQAQTLANLYLALEQNLTIIPVLNKIDLPAADVSLVKKEVMSLIGCREDEVLLVSAKTGQGVDKVLQAVIDKVPPPQVNEAGSLRALIFDSMFDDYRGVVAYVRLVDGTVRRGDKIILLGTGATEEVLEVGVFKPKLIPKEVLNSGDIGYIVTGLKEVARCRVGDTIAKETVPALPGYKEAKPMVFAGIFCKEGSDYSHLREGIGKLKLNDAALTFEPENSPALGFGLRCGFLGMLHLDIIQERLHREFDLDLIVTVPSVAYTLHKTNGEIFIIKSPQELPESSLIDFLEEPIYSVDIVTPKNYLGAVMELVREKRGEYKTTEFLDEKIAILHYDIPLASLIIDFYDRLKSVSAGFASLNYTFKVYQKTDVVRLDILVATEPVEALSTIVYKDESYRVGKKVVGELKKILPRQMFEVKLQAAIGGTIVASEKISAMRKDVTAKLYGGDVSRKRKLLEKQKKGKKKMRTLGKVDIPAEAFIAVLKR